MPTEVHLILTGILAIQPWNVARNANQWRIVVPTVPGHHTPHVTTLMVEKAAVVGAPPPYARSFTGGNRTIDLGWWVLTHDEIVVQSTVAAGGASTIPPELIRMSEACLQGDCHRLEDPGSGKYGLAALATVPSAAIEATFVDTRIDWSFERPPKPKSKGHVAEEVCLTFEIDDSNLKLDLHDATTGAARHTIEIQPLHGRIEVRLSNLTSDQVVPDCRSDPSLTDPHFDVYYDLSKSTQSSEKAKLKGRKKQSGKDEKKHDHRLTLLPDKKCPPLSKKSPAGANCPPTTWDDGP